MDIWPVRSTGRTGRNSAKLCNSRLFCFAENPPYKYMFGRVVYVSSMYMRDRLHEFIRNNGGGCEIFVYLTVFAVRVVYVKFWVDVQAEEGMQRSSTVPSSTQSSTLWLLLSFMTPRWIDWNMAFILYTFRRSVWEDSRVRTGHATLFHFYLAFTTLFKGKKSHSDTSFNETYRTLTVSCNF